MRRVGKMKTILKLRIVNLKKLKYDFKKDLTGKTGKQTLMLYFSQIIGLFLGLFTSIIN